MSRRSFVEDGRRYIEAHCDLPTCRAMGLGEGDGALHELAAAGWTCIFVYGDRCPMHAPPDLEEARGA